jgi:hypothetical protein
LGKATNPGLDWGAVEPVAADLRDLFMTNCFFICSRVIAVQVFLSSKHGGWERLGAKRLLYCGGVMGLHW